MDIHYLIFDACDDGQGMGSWDAMASVRVAQLPQVLAEVQAILAWAESTSRGPRAPLDEGGLWDADHQVQTEGEWVTVSLALTGPHAWGEALMARFLLDD